ncbi:MAG: hypothetical protein LWX83_16290 [Anaerolineae bacterium]|nr:hypothetical protein [Anaerolineae bacterium]
MIKQIFNTRTIIIALAVWGVLCAVLAAGIFLTQPAAQVINVVPSAVVTVIVAPTPTLPVLNTEPAPSTSNGTEAPGETHILLNKGDFVQITGTENQGLSVRSGPGTENKVLLIATEDELFEVKDGPVSAGGYNWWYLVSPRDSNRFGWAVDEFLKPVPKPQ